MLKVLQQENRKQITEILYATPRLSASKIYVNDPYETENQPEEKVRANAARFADGTALSSEQALRPSPVGSWPCGFPSLGHPLRFLRSAGDKRGMGALRTCSSSHPDRIAMLNLVAS